MIICIRAAAQDFGDAKECHINVNDNLLPVEYDPRVNATFKFSVNGSCSGTLINRYVNNNNLGYYFITARHCINANEENNLIKFMFNYQSPTAVSEEAAPSNIGADQDQSRLYDNNPNNNNFYEYYHESYVRKVVDYLWGDFALYEILTPLPPHFNVTFSGWNPSAFVPAPLSTPCVYPGRFIGIHHPRGDIKKKSWANNAMINYTPISTGCYTVTTIVDFLFSWLWGNRGSTQIVCNYVDVPWITIFQWCSGTIESGSSGSGLFGIDGRLTGVLSGDPFEGCIVSGPTTYGKFKNSYVRQDVKNTLNPGNSQFVDAFGLPHRRIECYNSLELPGTVGIGEYFPANHYQAENKVILRSASDIDVTKKIIIYPGADYEFHAPGEIDSGNEIEIMEGAEFETYSSGCQPQRLASPYSAFINVLKDIKMPSKKESNKVSYLTANPMEIFPNPAIERVHVKLNVRSADPDNKPLFYINNSVGKQLRIKSEQSQYGLGTFHTTFDVSDLAQGFYILTIEFDGKRYSGKFIKQ